MEEQFRQRLIAYSGDAQDHVRFETSEAKQEKAHRSNSAIMKPRRYRCGGAYFLAAANDTGSHAIVTSASQNVSPRRLTLRGKRCRRER